MLSKESLSWLSAEDSLDTTQRQWLYALLSGVILSIPWSLGLGTSMTMIFGMVFFIKLWQAFPIGMARKGQYWRMAYLSLFIFNALSTWWIWNSTIAGAIAAIVLNAALMSLPLLLARWIGKRLGNAWGLLSLPLAWLAFEWAHMNWELTWSWLNLGNAAAIQGLHASSMRELALIYPYLGSASGTLYYWVMGLLGYSIYRNRQAQKPTWLIVTTMALFIMPLAIWLFQMFVQKPTAGLDEKQTEVVVIQPNINPYTEKFADSPNYIPADQQISRMIQLSDSLITPKTQFVLWPETSLPTAITEEHLDEDPTLLQLRQWLEQYPNLMLITGATTTKLYTKETKTPTARYYEPADAYFDVFNTAIALQKAMPTQLYHKSKLVPGVERLPYPWLLGWLSESVFNLGGTAGSLGDQPNRVVFTHRNGIKVAPVICYESAYGNFVQSYMPLQPDFIAIITNDAWWGDTPGYEHHWQYGKLRALENHIPIARSANTGISGFIETDGSTSGLQTEYATRDALRATLTLSQSRTLYSQTGDWLSYLAMLGLLALLIKAIWGGR